MCWHSRSAPQREFRGVTPSLGKGPVLDGNQLGYGMDLLHIGIAPGSQFSQNQAQMSLIFPGFLIF